jgi:hypothetical protein
MNEGSPLSPYLSSEAFLIGGASFIKKDYENVSVGMYAVWLMERRTGRLSSLSTGRSELVLADSTPQMCITSMAIKELQLGSKKNADWCRVKIRACWR